MNSPHSVILGSHLIFTGYAHWLPNDLRGSGSEEIRKASMEDLGTILPGRQHPQPPRDDVKTFFKDAKGHLDHASIWFNESHRRILAQSIAETSRLHGYTLWALAICSNHVHAVVRSHRHKSDQIWFHLANAMRSALQNAGAVPMDHPVWSHRAYKVFLRTPGQVRGRIQYVLDNPTKERLPRQLWEFIVPYTG